MKNLEKPHARHFVWLFEIPLSLLGFKIKQPVFLAGARLLNCERGWQQHPKASCPLSPQLLASGRVKRPSKLGEGFLPSSR